MRVKMETTKKLNHYQRNKHDVGYRAIMNENRRRFYWNNVEQEKQKARDRYYRAKDAPLVALALQILQNETN